VGGAKASMHLFGYASDINLGTKELNKKLFEYIQKNLYYTELVNEYDYKWVHVSIVKNRENEKVVKVIK